MIFYDPLDRYFNPFKTFWIPRKFNHKAITYSKLGRTLGKIEICVLDEYAYRSIF